MKFPIGQTPNPKAGLATSEKRRLILFGVGFFVVLGILVSTWMQGRAAGPAPAPVPVADESASLEPLLAVPEIDRERLESLVADRAEADQVVLPSEAADLLLDAARRYTPRHFAELDVPELDAARIAEITADPAAARGRPFTARGRIVGLRERSGAAHEEQFLGELELQDGGTVHFLVLSVPEHAADVGGFVRVDGLFLKLHRTEDELQPGTWSAGPLLVGARAVRSYPALGPETVLDMSVFDDVVDAELSPDEGEEVRLVNETPAVPLWTLMALARDLPEDAVDWSAAPELDQRLLDAILDDPAAFRGAVVRVPISRLQDGRVRGAGENPARMERYMEGWIGNTTWRNVIQFKTPVLRPDLLIGDLVHGRGFFLQNLAYESAERGIRVAPVFVLQSLERHVPEESVVLTRIPWVMAGLGLFLGVLFVVLARRDRRRSADFHQEIVRRRRERRGRKGDVGTASP